MPAFDALEARIVNLTLAAGSDSPERVVVIGLLKEAPADDHPGEYGRHGEPASGGAYRRARIAFGPQAAQPETGGAAQTSNVDAVTITGLAPGVYTHFALFGSNSGGAA